MLLAMVLLPACTRSVPRSFDRDEPDGRIQAIVDVARTEDRERIKDLVEQLDSDDAAVRMFSIRTLERLTGQTLGYRHSDPRWRRLEAIDRWVAHIAERDLP